MTSTDTLLPCPFCGGAAEVREWDFPYVRFQARCVECKTTGRTRFNERAKAIAAWNHRTPPTPAAEEREAVARAISTKTFAYCIGGSGDCGDWEEMDPRATAIYLKAADAALSALRETRAAEILAAEARGVEMERARVVAWLRRPFWGDDTSVIIGQAHIAAACDIERGEHDTGKEG